jgi:hypothetical protein
MINILFEQTNKKTNKGNFVENKTESNQHAFKEELNFLYA